VIKPAAAVPDRAAAHLAPGHGRARAIVRALAITQTVGYGTLYYAFAVFLVPMTAGLHAGTGAITGAFTASVLTSAALAVPVGRRLDRHGGRALMTGGSLLGAVLLAAWSQVHALWQLYLVQIGIGAASAASLYEAAFAVIIAWHAPRQRSAALLTLTVVAGFASTVFLPLTGWLVHAYGWRTALLLLAAIQAGLTVPLHAAVLRPAPAPPSRSPRAAAPLRQVFTDPVFWLLTAAFTANTAAIAVVTVHLVAALIGWGHPATLAATTAGLFGLLSVTGRLVTTGLQRRYRTVPVVAATFALQGLSAALLPLVGRDSTLAVLAVVGFGLGFGVATIAKPVLLAERYDTRRYATIAGAMVVPVTVAKATAPLGAAWLAASGGGYGAVFAGVGLAGLVAATALVAVLRAPSRRDEKPAPVT
jgi:MFS family permease